MGSTPCRTAPRMLKMSPKSQIMMKAMERPSVEERRVFSIICGEKTTTQQAMEMELRRLVLLKGSGSQWWSFTQECR